MSIVALSGWGQPHDTLAGVVPKAEHLDYTRAGSVKAALNLLAKQAPKVVIGWSMGGQLAVRAIAEGRIKPEKLVLIATPFQFVHSTTLALGMGLDTFNQFRDNLQRDPARTFRKSYALITHGDSRAAQVDAHLANSRARLPDADWRYWLDALSSHSCHGMDVSGFPPTLLIHGEADVVVPLPHSETFMATLPDARLKTLPECGHAPHWHEQELVRNWIAQHIAPAKLAVHA